MYSMKNICHCLLFYLLFSCSQNNNSQRNDYEDSRLTQRLSCLESCVVIMITFKHISEESRKNSAIYTKWGQLNGK